jgi:hypothetical protein
MQVERERVVAVVMSIRGAILAQRAVAALRQAADPRRSEIVRAACAEHAVRLEDWIGALEADVELFWLFHAAVREVTVDPPDLGPYDEISRESPLPARE